MNILISGFRLDVDDICALLGKYEASYSNYHTTPRNNTKSADLNELFAYKEKNSCSFPEIGEKYNTLFWQNSKFFMLEHTVCILGTTFNWKI